MGSGKAGIVRLTGRELDDRRAAQMNRYREQRMVELAEELLLANGVKVDWM